MNSSGRQEVQMKRLSKESIAIYARRNSDSTQLFICLLDFLLVRFLVLICMFVCITVCYLTLASKMLQSLEATWN